MSRVHWWDARSNTTHAVNRFSPPHASTTVSNSNVSTNLANIYDSLHSLYGKTNHILKLMVLN